MSSPIISLDAVSRVYDEGKVKVRALNQVTLEIGRGEFVVLAGPSGSGKTTLLNLIGLLDTPTSGKVKLLDNDVSELTGSQRARLRLTKLGFVFQSYNLIPVLTARENAEFVLTLKGVSAAERRQKVTEVLQAVGLSGLEDRRPAELSGGQQQRVAIARAIVGEPVLVLADEPTANLDSKTAVELIELMRRLNRERGVTFVFSSHDPRVIDRARRLVRIVDGEIDSDERHEQDAA